MSTSALKPFPGNISFHAQHAPLGAFASFTCGLFGSPGGFGVQIGRPGDQDLYIGIKRGERNANAPVTCLPFFKGAASDEAARYDVEKKSAGAGGPGRPGIESYQRDRIKRYYGWGTDRWVTDDFEFSLYTPFFPVPEYGEGSVHQLSVLPAIIAELTVDNTQGTTPKTAVFAMRFPKAGARLLDDMPGFAWRDQTGVRGAVHGSERCRVESFMRWKLDDALNDINPRHSLGGLPGIAMTVPAGERATLRLALGVYVDGFVTTRLRGQYRYTRGYSGLEMVLDTALQRFDHLKEQAELLDRQLLATGLSGDQQFLIAHATRSYHGSTQFLDVGGEPFWVVNEGEYCMMNTLDLSVDQVFWELRQHPWLVLNLLDRFVRHYSYVDQVKVPKPDTAERLSQKHVTQSDDHISTEPRVLGELLPLDAFELRPGGLSFTHDMGVHNNFSPAGYSSYELPNLVGCFGYMTCEQLCNWTLMAGSYVAHTGDLGWARRNQHTIRACLDSLMNRSGDAGYVMYDSSRCEGGSEITTYDSLDHSLAQTRNNLYMAVKCWASYVGLRMLLGKLGDSAAAAMAGKQAGRCVESILKQAGPDGIFPAVFEKENPGHASRILPAIEGLVYPAVWGEDVSAWSALHEAMAKHTIALLTDPQKRNQFADGGIKLSSTSDNSWMSKIAIFQYVCTDVLKLASNPKIKALLAEADAAHVKWMTEGESAYWACSDQFVSGVAKGSKYYPRIVTSVLWMKTGDKGQG